MTGRLTRLWLLIAALLALAAPARADDISAAGRSVVRVVVIAFEDGEVGDFGHGSGFAVAPNRIITNAHVVALAAQYPDNVVVGVVPSEGNKAYRARVIASDPARDLALIELGPVTVRTVEDAPSPPLRTAGERRPLVDATAREDEPLGLVTLPVRGGHREAALGACRAVGARV